MADTGDGWELIRFTAYGGRGFSVGVERFVVKLPRVYDMGQLWAQWQLNGADVPGARIVDGQTIELSAQNLIPGNTWTLQAQYPEPWGR